ncbi:hypothetical protein VPH35_052783 [Triticum aestivum]|uniref:H(+)-transporting two-sector ATPase n=1 Tax=Triticum aestivum TaxID=4565 RepID=A0A077RZJ0_WHEAT|nr:unnamed protein product [Triticum aestivum]
MPQLDKLTYFSQFFWLCLLLFTSYILLFNNNNGILGISRILKLRNQLLSRRGGEIQSKDPKNLEDISRKGFSTGLSYMYSSLSEVSQWCKTVDYLGKRRKITLISDFGEISGSRGMERQILYLISKSSYNTSSSRITCWNNAHTCSTRARKHSIMMKMNGILGRIGIFLLMIVTAFIGYVPPWGQMSFWGATVITSLASTIPVVGDTIVTWLSGGFSVDNATLNRFFSLHHLLVLVLPSDLNVLPQELQNSGRGSPLFQIMKMWWRVMMNQLIHQGVHLMIHQLIHQGVHLMIHQLIHRISTRIMMS